MSGRPRPGAGIDGPIPDETPSDAAFERACPLLALRIGDCLFDQMMLLSRELGVDYESVVLWGVMSQWAGPRPGPAAGGAGAGPRTAPRPVRIRDLAGITGIPRETVRRKLLRLQDAGRVERVALGWAVVRGPGDPALRGFVRHAVDRFQRTARELEQLLADASDGTDDPTGG
jgi:hypothetical protein